MTDEQTAFQRLISDEAQAVEMKNDFERLMDSSPDNPLEGEGWELKLTVWPEDLPYLIEELEELLDEQ